MLVINVELMSLNRYQQNSGNAASTHDMYWNQFIQLPLSIPTETSAFHFQCNFFQGNIACYYRENAILVSFSPWEWRSRAPSLIDFLLAKKERTRRWGLVENLWCTHAWHLQVCKTTRLSYFHRRPCLVPVCGALPVSSPESNTMLNVQKNPLYFLSFPFFLEPHWCCSSSAVSCQTMRACLFIS